MAASSAVAGFGKRQGWLAGLSDPRLLLVVVYFVAAPFYVFPSAMPQPADLSLLALAMLVGVATGFVPAFRHFISNYVLCAFVTYVAAVNTYWAVLEQRLGYTKGSILLNTLFYLFNLLVVLTVTALYVRFRGLLLRVITAGASAALLTQAALTTIFHSTRGLREEMFFNNPNQLGFFALLCATIFAVGAKWLKVPFGYQVITYAAAVYLSLLSLSKAAMLGTALLVLVTMLRRPGTVVVAALVISGTVYLSDFGNALVQTTEQRLMTVGRSQDDTLEGRGYMRILEHPEHLAFGAGEGAVDRFDPVHPIEIHSSAGTLLFSYGVVGSALFLLFLYHVLKLASPYLIAHLIPVTFYTLTHQGLRESMFWILLAFLQCLAAEIRSQRKLPRLVVDRPHGAEFPNRGLAAPVGLGGNA